MKILEEALSCILWGWRDTFLNLMRIILVVVCVGDINFRLNFGIYNKHVCKRTENIQVIHSFLPLSLFCWEERISRKCCLGGWIISAWIFLCLESDNKNVEGESDNKVGVCWVRMSKIVQINIFTRKCIFQYLEHRKVENVFQTVRYTGLKENSTNRTALRSL